MFYFKRIFLFLLTLTFSLSSVAQSLPDGVIQEGSLANQQLINDTMYGVVAKVVSLGCEKPEQFSAYIKEMPSGAVGVRVWRELWIVEGCADEYQIKIRFNETGLESASWIIE
ncbi:hypothetical protein [Vibrio metschnikovii]|uniref:hypothetical protein n=1 Tax=Vibrio metschnikovii TaxID=28172 RepID=UPI002FCB9831